MEHAVAAAAAAAAAAVVVGWRRGSKAESGARRGQVSAAAAWMTRLDGRCKVMEAVAIGISTGIVSELGSSLEPWARVGEAGRVPGRDVDSAAAAAWTTRSDGARRGGATEDRETHLQCVPPSLPLPSSPSSWVGVEARRQTATALVAR